jgi:hypothetical protein
MRKTGKLPAMLAEAEELPDAAIAWRACDRTEWEALYFRAGRSSLEQAWAYGEAVATAYKQEIERHLLCEGDAPLALVQVLRRRRGPVGISRILRGPVWLIDPLSDPRGEAVCAALARRYRARRLDFLSWLPELPDDPQARRMVEAQGLRRVVTGYASAWLDLRSDQETLLAGLQGKWRSALRKAEREGLEVSEDTKARQRQAALLLYDTFRRKKRFVGPSGDFISTIAAADPKALLSLTARHEGKLLAGVILLRHGASATYLASWTSAVGREGQAHNLLLWRGIEVLKAGGCQWLDLGGLNTESQQGLARFKLGLGGEVFVLTGSYL